MSSNRPFAGSGAMTRAISLALPAILAMAGCSGDANGPAKLSPTTRPASARVSGPGPENASEAPLGGTGRGTGTGPRSHFFSYGGNAYHICYVVDCSGSMIESLDRVRQELLISIGRLSPKQDFHVILFAKDAPKEAPARELVPATARYKEVAATFLDSVRAAGRTDPIPALHRAFTVLGAADPRRPGKLIYLLTDGDFPDGDGLLTAIRKLNKDKSVHINTYLYDYKGRKAVELMQTIAKESGGRYKYVSRDD